MSLILEKCQNCYFMIDSSKYSMYSFVAHIKKACIEKVCSTGCNLTRDAYVAVKIYIILIKKYDIPALHSDLCVLYTGS